MKIVDKDISNKQIGNRIKAVRSIYNEGIRLTVEQFSHLLDISNEQLLNYENGRSALPINILIELYNRGINPIFILTGEADVLAGNKAGNELRKKLHLKNIDYNAIINDALMSVPADSTLSLQTIKVSAGKINMKN
jgi:transcriptional regulator with XRE-family HTH domain